MKIKQYIISKYQQLKQRILPSVRGCNISEDDLLKGRISEAKEKIIYFWGWGASGNGCDTKYIKNYSDIIDILKYEDTLGMKLFVRDFIASKKSVDECFNYLKW